MAVGKRRRSDRAGRQKTGPASRDPNVQIRELSGRARGVQAKIDPAWSPFFNILWKSKILGAGSGPWHEKDVIEGIAGVV